MRSQRHERRGLSTWASVRRWENATRERLQRQHWLWLHGWCIGVAVMLVMWAMAHLQMVTGSASLGLRYAVTLGTGYLVFLCILRWWAGRLVRGDGRFEGDAGIDLPDLPLPRSAGPRPTIETGGGGDFAGGGAQASFDAPGDSVAIEVPADTSSLAGDVASGALEVAGGADEGAVVVIPVVVVFLAGLLVLFGFGSLLLLYFGWEVLLAVAVEIAFGYVSARTAVRLAREGWLNAAVRLTWKPLLGALACAVLLGVLIDHFVPQARSLPQAVKLLRR